MVDIASMYICSYFILLGIQNSCAALYNSCERCNDKVTMVEGKISIEHNVTLLAVALSPVLSFFSSLHWGGEKEPDIHCLCMY